MKGRLLQGLALLAIVGLAGPVSAHHSFAMFDRDQEVWLEGSVKEFQWRNPHTFIQVLVEDDAGVVEWSLEGGSPNILARNGWKRTVLSEGDHVRILMHPLRNGTPGGAFLEVHKDDGSVYYYHG